MTRFAAGLRCIGLLVICACEGAGELTKKPQDATTAESTAARLALTAPHSILDSSMARAESLHLGGEFDSARTTWEAVLRVTQAQGDSVRASRALTWLGLAAWRQGDYARAHELGERALAMKLQLGTGVDISRSYNALGLLTWNEGRLDEATGYFENASASASVEGDLVATARAMNNLALVNVERGRFRKARAGFAESARLGRELGDARIEGGGLTNLGMLDVELGDAQSALPRLVRARELYRSIDYETGEQNALAQLASAHQSLGDIRLAIAAIDSATERARAQGLRQEEAANLELAASIYRQAGELTRALQLYERAYLVDRDLGLSVDGATNRRNAAEIEASLGRSDLAARHGAEALRLHLAAGSHFQVLRDRLLLATLASSAGNRTESSRQLRAADETSARLEARSARVEVALTKATIASREGDAREALRVLSRAQSDLRMSSFASEWQEASLRMQAYSALSLFDSAATAGRVAVQAVERMRGRLGSGTLATLYAGDKASTYTSLVEVLLKLGGIGEAFETADAARGRDLIEHLTAADTISVAHPVTIRSLAEGNRLLRTIGALVVRLDSLEETPPGERDTAARAKASELEALIAETRTAYEQLLSSATRRDAAGAALLGGRRIAAAEVQSALRSDEALLEYVVTPQQLLLFVVSRQAIRQVSAPVSRGDLMRQVRVLRDEIGRRGVWSADSASISSMLHASLIAPAEEAGLLRGVQSLIIVPHSVLAHLPFAALRRKRDGRHVVEDYTLLHMSSAAALAALRSNRGEARPSGDLAVSTGFAPFPRQLPGSARELSAFRRSRRESHAVRGRQATEVRLRSALSLSATVHIATHGELNSRNPMFSRIALAPGTGVPGDDGRLEVHEVLGLRIGSGLVFLSGCETGLGASASAPSNRVEDYASLAQSFLFAGARDVVSTLWRIEDEGAADFATRFYSQLGAGDATYALAMAQRESIAKVGNSRPFYWAAYQVSGAGELGAAAHTSRPRSVKP